MKIPSAPAVTTRLNGGAPYMLADLYTIGFVGGGQVLLTSFQEDVKIGASTWLAHGPQIYRNGLAFKCGLEVDELDLTVLASPSDLVLGKAWYSALRAGLFDGATVQLDQAVGPPGGAPWDGFVTLFQGRVAEVDLDGAQAQIKVNSQLELLNANFPRNIYQTACAHTLFDAGCRLSKSAFAQSGTVTSVASSQSFHISVSQPDLYFSLGQIVFSSGLNAGLSRSILHHAAGAVFLMSPFPFAVATSDAFTIYPGCDKTTATCSAKFDNLANYGGQPFVPQAETAV